MNGVCGFGNALAKFMGVVFELVMHVAKGNERHFLARGLGERDRFGKVWIAIVTTAAIFPNLYHRGLRADRLSRRAQRDRQK